MSHLKNDDPEILSSALKNTVFVSAHGMRALAAYIVCVVHVVSPTINFESTPHEGFNWWLLILFEALGKWAVPVFLMLSGAFLLDPFKWEPATVFYQKRMSKILIPTLFWSAFYILVSHFHSATNPSVLQSVGKFLSGEPFYHLYYLFIALGLYLFTPLLKYFVKYAKSTERIAFALFCLVLAAASNLLGQFSNHFEFNAKPNKHALDMFIPFLGYFLIGYDLSILKIQKIKQKFPFILAGFLVSWTATALLFSYCTKINGTYYGIALASNYISFNIMLMSVCVFLLLRLVFESSVYQKLPEFGIFKKLVVSISKYSFGIYLCHPVFIAAFRFKIFEPLNIEPYFLSVPILGFVLYVFGYVFTFVVTKIPVLKRIV
jgi:surface polysaccharide O-acyltransferase-like enzyme